MTFKRCHFSLEEASATKANNTSTCLRAMPQRLSDVLSLLGSWDVLS